MVAHPGSLLAVSLREKENFFEMRTDRTKSEKTHKHVLRRLKKIDNIDVIFCLQRDR